jgi:hypothetical protein
MKAAGISDEAVEKATGKDWKQWFAVLDKAGAHKLDHRAIAAMIDQNGAPPWWSQMVTVAYEQARGLREKHQKAGGYAASASKTVSVPVGKLYRAVEARLKKENGLAIRKATPGKSLRIAGEDGTRIDVSFYAKGEAKSLVAVQQEKLSGPKEVVRAKKFWAELLAGLAASLR